VGDQTFLRFVPGDGDEVVRDRLTCLSLVTCAEDTPRHIPDDLREQAYEAWAAARRDIHAEWMLATDPANLHPSLRRLFREAVNHLRNYPPQESQQRDIEQAIEALQAPWGRRVENVLRGVFDPDATYLLGGPAREVSRLLIEKVRELGLRPYKAPEPLPVIAEHEVMLVCWMAVALE
jgi:hypothetical protein